MAEIFPMKGNTIIIKEPEVDDLNHKPPSNHEDDAKEVIPDINISGTVPRIDTDSPHKEKETTPQIPRRKAAEKARNLMKELMDNSALLVKGLIRNSTSSTKTKRREEDPPEPPEHSFIYSDWLAMLDDDGPNDCGNDIIDQSIDGINDKDSQGLEILRNALLSRNIDPDPCSEQVLETVHDYIDFHTVGARI